MEANEETSEKENMKNRRYEERKQEKVEVGLVAARETEASGTTELAKWTTENLSIDPTAECGTCFSVSAEIFSLVSPNLNVFEKILDNNIRRYSNNTRFLTPNSAAVAPVVANCTERCTRRKVTVSVHSTNKKAEK